MELGSALLFFGVVCFGAGLFFGRARWCVLVALCAVTGCVDDSAEIKQMQDDLERLNQQIEEVEKSQFDSLISSEIGKQQEIIYQNCPGGICPTQAVIQDRAFKNWSRFNYQREEFEGSCAWASFANNAIASGQLGVAGSVRVALGGGVFFESFCNDIVSLGCDGIKTNAGEIGVLDYANKKGLGAVIWYRCGPGMDHACAFQGWDDEGHAIIIDPNHGIHERIQRQRFIREWLKSGGKAIVVTNFKNRKHWT